MTSLPSDALQTTQTQLVSATQAVPPAAAHGEEGGGEPPELENFWNLLAKTSLNKEGAPTHKVVSFFDPYVKDPALATVNRTHQNVFFSGFSVLLIIWLLRRGMRRRAMIPNRAQSAVEILIDGLNRFFLNILGEKHGHRYTPFLIALFLFVFTNNIMGLVPLMKSSTSAFQNNIVIGLLVFFYVQYTGLRYNGVKNYVLHLLGNPQGAIMWIMSPFLLMLHVISELVKPLSLSLRLFGNVLGDDILLGVFAMLGIMVVTAVLKPIGIEHPIIGLPLEIPFMFLGLLAGTIQALIFSLLSCIYILLMLPHDEEGHH